MDQVRLLASLNADVASRGLHPIDLTEFGERGRPRVPEDRAAAPPDGARNPADLPFLDRQGSRVTFRELSMRILLKKILLRTGVVVAATALWITHEFVLTRGRTPGILDSSGRPVRNSVAELERVDPGGATQWILIRGWNRQNSVLLFLHGVPGMSASGGGRTCPGGRRDGPGGLDRARGPASDRRRVVPLRRGAVGTLELLPDTVDGPVGPGVHTGRRAQSPQGTGLRGTAHVLRRPPGSCGRQHEPGHPRPYVRRHALDSPPQRGSREGKR